MYGTGNQVAVWPCHISAQLSAKADIQPGWGYYFLIRFPYLITYAGNIRLPLIRHIGYAYAPGKIDKGNIRPCGLVQLRRNIEQFPRQRGEICVIGGAACKECMNAELLYSL